MFLWKSLNLIKFGSTRAASVENFELDGRISGRNLALELRTALHSYTKDSAAQKIEPNTDLSPTLRRKTNCIG